MQGDDTQANHLDDMQVDEINAADPVSAGWQVDASFSISGNTSEEIHSTWAEVSMCSDALNILHSLTQSVLHCVDWVKPRRYCNLVVVFTGCRMGCKLFSFT